MPAGSSVQFGATAIQEIVNYLSSDSELKALFASKENIDEFFGTYKAQLDVWEKMVEYEGFNAITILRIAKGRYDKWVTDAATNANQITTVTFSYKDGGEEKDLTIDLTKSFATVLSLLIFIFVNRGCTWSKITKKISKAASNFLEIVKEMLGLDTDEHGSGSALAPEIVTVARLSQCVPFFSLEFYFLKKAKLFFSMSSLHLDPALISSVVLCPLFNTIIPQIEGRWNNGQNPHYIAFLACIHMDRIINRRKAVTTSMKDLLRYYEASFRTPVMTNTARMDLLNKYGLANAAGTGMNPTFLAASNNCKESIRALCITDPDLDYCISTLGDMC
uniref:Putative nucleocapsid n=1 Tax=Thrips tabaci associated bunyavirales 1 TaxID=2771478 RepID=A0A7H1D352_9VIRU|nr:putative nucleocapsid [Thrips tabaci associated bunyavirales 1]